MHCFLHLMPEPVVLLNHKATVEDLKRGEEYLYDFVVTNSLCYFEKACDNARYNISFSRFSRLTKYEFWQLLERNRGRWRGKKKKKKVCNKKRRRELKI